MEELIEHITRALWHHRYPGIDSDRGGPLGDLAKSDAAAVAEALGIDERHWVQHDGAHKRYFVITWTGADQ